MKNVKKKIEEHIGGFILFQNEVGLILKLHPEFKFVGTVYRALTFSKEVNNTNIERDVCFSNNPKSAFLRGECDSNEDYVEFWRAEIIGLDINKSCEILEIWDEMREENEIAACEVLSSQRLFCGSEYEYKKWFRLHFDN